MMEELVRLKPYNTFGLDATAKFLARITDLASLQHVLNDARLKNEPRFILGGGSNILLTKDIDGLVIKNEIGGIETVDEDDSSFLVRAGSGVIWNDLVKYCVSHGYAGIENLTLIPGRVGAAPMQNIGAYGVELKDVFESLDAVELATGELRKFNAQECAFGYRESVFKHALKGEYIITSVTLRLQKQPKLNTTYGSIGRLLDEKGIPHPTIRDVSNAVAEIRRSKLPDPAVLGNAGSFFKNPVVAESEFEKLQSKFPDIPNYPAANGRKLAAGWLIDQCGWKGKVVGRTGCHAQQALVLVNHGGATGKEVLGLSDSIMSSVAEKFGVELQREVNVY